MNRNCGALYFPICCSISFLDICHFYAEGHFTGVESHDIVIIKASLVFPNFDGTLGNLVCVCACICDTHIRGRSIDTGVKQTLHYIFTYRHTGCPILKLHEVIGKIIWTRKCK
jgi:hypothetical protein